MCRRACCGLQNGLMCSAQFDLLHVSNLVKLNGGRRVEKTHSRVVTLTVLAQ